MAKDFRRALLLRFYKYADVGGRCNIIMIQKIIVPKSVKCVLCFNSDSYVVNDTSFITKF